MLDKILAVIKELLGVVRDFFTSQRPEEQAKKKKIYLTKLRKRLIKKKRILDTKIQECEDAGKKAVLERNLSDILNELDGVSEELSTPTYW